VKNFLEKKTEQCNRNPPNFQLNIYIFRNIKVDSVFTSQS